MPFTHSNSRLVTITHRHLFTTVLGLTMLACVGEGVTDSRGEVMAVVVHPQQVTLAPDQTQHFAAYSLVASGDSAVALVDWSATGGQVHSDGTYVPNSTPGTYQVVATHAQRSWLSDTASVQVTSGTSLPGSVGDLVVVGQTESSLRLELTEVDDGSGNPADYTVRFAQSPINWGNAGGSEFVVDGVQVGATLQFQITGLASGTQYDVQCIAFRGSLNDGAVFSDQLSNVATGTTQSGSTVPVATVSVTPSSLTLTTGNTSQLTAELRDAAGNLLSGRSVIWSSSNSNVATVSSGGLVTAVAQGSATISAESEGKSGSANVQVTTAGTSLPGSVGDLVIVGQTESSLTLELTEVDDGSGNPADYAVRFAQSPINWGNAGGSEFVVDGVQVGATLQFQITGLASGTQYDVQCVAFRGTLNQGAVFSANLSNVATGATQSGSTVPVATVSVSPSSLTLTTGSTSQLTAELRDAAGNLLSGRLVTWSSSNPNVATVSSGGLVTAVAEGSTTISATSEGKTGNASITVENSTAPVATVSVSPASATIAVGNTRQFTAELRDAAGNLLSGRSVTWSSSNSNVATVSSGGLVTAAAEGSATISATSEGKTGSASVSVIGGSTVEIVFEDDFETGNLDKWQSVNGAKCLITSDPANVFTGVHALDLKINSSTGSQSGMGKWFHPMMGPDNLPGYDEVYFVMDVMFDDNWATDPTVSTHYFLLRGNRTDDPWSGHGEGGRNPTSGTDFFSSHAEPHYKSDDWALYSYHMDAPGPWGNVARQEPPRVTIGRNTWQHYVHHVKLNTPGQADGSEAIYIDNVLVVERTGMRFRSSTILNINELRFDAWWDSGPSNERHIYIDNVRVQTTRPLELLPPSP